MQRIATGTRKLNLFGVGKDGFTAGNPNSKIPATQLSATWFNTVQEEIANAIEVGNYAFFSLDPSDNTQLRQAILRGGKYEYKWGPPQGNGTTRPFEWSSEDPLVKWVNDGKTQLLVETYQKQQGAVAAIGDFLPDNFTCGVLSFEVLISAKNGTPVPASHRCIEGKVFWKKSFNVVTFETVTETYNGGSLAATLSVPVGGSVVGVLITIAANGTYANFNLQARCWLNLLPWLP